MAAPGRGQRREGEQQRDGLVPGRRRHVQPGPDGWRTTLNHRLDLFDGATAERLLSHWTALLAAALERPETPVLDLPLLRPAIATVVIIKGINVYTLAVQDVILGMRPAVTGEYQIVLHEAPPLTNPPLVRVEYDRRLEADGVAHLRERLARRIREALVFTPAIELVPCGTLPIAERKARRLVRAYLGEQP